MYEFLFSQKLLGRHVEQSHVRLRNVERHGTSTLILAIRQVLLRRDAGGKRRGIGSDYTETFAVRHICIVRMQHVGLRTQTIKHMQIDCFFGPWWTVCI
jgi:hypothetical protein